MLEVHNLNIMKKKKFLEQFESDKIELLYCDYYGMLAFNFYAFDDYDGLKKILGFVLLIAQRSIHLIFKLLFKKFRIETSIFSPYIIFIGRKI